MTQSRSGTFFVKGEKIVLRKDGVWIADGVEITHEQTRELFFKSVAWDTAEKKFKLSVGYETIFIEVEDTPYFVTSLEHGKGGSCQARLSNHKTVPVEADRLAYENGNLYLGGIDGQRAKFLSAAYYDLLKSLEEDDAWYYLTISGKRANLSPKGSESSAGLRAAPKRR